MKKYRIVQYVVAWLLGFVVYTLLTMLGAFLVHMAIPAVPRLGVVDSALLMLGIRVMLFDFINITTISKK